MTGPEPGDLAEITWTDESGFEQTDTCIWDAGVWSVLGVGDAYFAEVYIGDEQVRGRPSSFGGPHRQPRSDDRGGVVAASPAVSRSLGVRVRLGDALGSGRRPRGPCRCGCSFGHHQTNHGGLSNDE